MGCRRVVECPPRSPDFTSLNENQATLAVMGCTHIWCLDDTHLQTFGAVSGYLAYVKITNVQKKQPQNNEKGEKGTDISFFIGSALSPSAVESSQRKPKNSVTMGKHCL